MARRHKGVISIVCVGFGCHSRKMKYLIFSFIRFGSRQNVALSSATHYFQNSVNVGNRVSLTLGSLCLP